MRADSPGWRLDGRRNRSLIMHIQRWEGRRTSFLAPGRLAPLALAALALAGPAAAHDNNPQLRVVRAEASLAEEILLIEGQDFVRRHDDDTTVTLAGNRL